MHRTAHTLIKSSTKTREQNRGSLWHIISTEYPIYLLAVQFGICYVPYWDVLFLMFTCFIYSLLRRYSVQVLLIFPQFDTNSSFHDYISLCSAAHLHRLKLIMVDYSRKSETASYLQQMWSQSTATFGKITSLSRKAMVWVSEWHIKLNQFKKMVAVHVLGSWK